MKRGARVTANWTQPEGYMKRKQLGLKGSLATNCATLSEEGKSGPNVCLLQGPHEFS